MGFEPEPTSYTRIAISGLQGAWQCLRNEVADNYGFDGFDKLLFHIDEAMSWESVREYFEEAILARKEGDAE